MNKYISSLIRRHNFTLDIFCLGFSLLITGCGGGSGNSSSTTTSAVSFASFNCPNTTAVSFPGVSGVRQVYGTSTNAAYVTGLYMEYGSAHAFLYNGLVTGGGTCNEFTFPTGKITYSNAGTSLPAIATTTSLYGPDSSSSIGTGNVIAVGSFTQLGSINPTTNLAYQYGLFYQGLADGSTTSGYKQILAPSIPPFLTAPEIVRGVSIINTIAHSSSGGFVVAPYNTSEDLIGAAARTLIYKVSDGTYFRFDNPNQASTSITAYGIWYNGGTSYTIAGGYTNTSTLAAGYSNAGFITDWDSATQVVSNFTELIYSPICNAPTLTGTCSVAATSNAINAHVEGITTDSAGGYNLSVDVSYVGKPGAGATDPAFMNIKRTGALGTPFATPTWTMAGYYPGSTWTSANTVYQNYLLGLYQTTVGSVVTDHGYVATIPGQ